MRPPALVTIHQPQYLPYIGLLAKIDAADTCVFFDTADYQTGYFDNRNRVMTRNGPAWLTIPVHATSRTPIRDIRICGRTWVRKHLATLHQSYGKSHHFEPHFSTFQALLRSQEWATLGEVAALTTRWLLDAFGITTATTMASDLGDGGGTAADRLIGLVSRAGGTAYLAGPSWGKYLNREDIHAFSTQGVAFHAAESLDVSYPGHHGFHPNLSAVDLLFSMGAAGITVIRDSIHVHEVAHGG